MSRFPCTLCSNCYSSLRDVVQHLCYPMDEEKLILPKCPIAHDCCSDASFKKGSTFRSHLSQYHPEWRTEGCPIKFRLSEESGAFVSGVSLEDNSESLHLNIDPFPQSIPQEVFGGHQTVSESLILDHIGKFYLQLYAEFGIPYSTIQDICNGIILISELNNARIIQQLKAGLDHLGVAADEVNSLCNIVSKGDVLFSSHHKSVSAQSCFVTDYLRREYFYSKHYNFKEPIEVNLSNNPKSKDKLQYVPVSQTLTEILEDPAVQKDVDASFCKQPFDEEVKDYTDGTLFKEELHEPKEIHLFLYQDGFNPVFNVLGSAKNKYKELVVYFTLGNLSAGNRSKVDTKYLIMLIREKVFKRVGAKKCFERLLAELKQLQTEGILYKGLQVPVKVINMLGDSLGQHMVGGFIESFSSSYFCRFCEITRKVFKASPTITKPQRSKENYARYVLKANLTEKPVKGIKQTCEFNSLGNFHAVRHLVCCLAHDILEGVVKWDLAGIIRNMTKKTWFTYKFLNKRIQHFKCNGIDSRNKPAFVRADGKKLGGHAVQNWSLLRLLPFIIGDKMEDLHDPNVELYVLLKQLVEYFCSHSFLKSDIPYIKDVLLPKYFQLRSVVLVNAKLYPLKPKHHYMMHYPELMLKYGPLIHLWTLGFEQKHKFFKHVCRMSRNFINVEYTCALRHQLNLAYQSTGPLLPKGVTEVGAVPLSPNSHKGELKRFLVQQNFNGEYRECRAITVDGVLYRREFLLLLSANENNIECGLLKAILCSENSVNFVLKILMATFDENFGICTLPNDYSQIGIFRIVSPYNLKYAQPQPVYSFKGKQCISLKGKVL
ncbi:UvrABC system protein C [Frankliniella fusca]|uniref:UvrABC system protein C n=1 Tax=Frankliniella fusca TaxID=407009 RepID=A0AAE1HS29_9NEOP|nr:UvrABC system protein C [Frankliniella fusca]